MSVVWPALLALACTGPHSSPKETGATKDSAVPLPSLSVLSANVGNLDPGCPGTPYQGALCSMEVEQVIRANIDGMSPDVAVLLEVLDADYCTKDLWKGDPDLPCTGAPDRDPYQQARRLVGDAYTITCDGIAHYDCIAVRAASIDIEECASGGLCMGRSQTPDQPPECEGIGTITSVSKVDATWEGLSFSLVASHPLNAITEEGDACRRAQYQQALETLPGKGPALLAGDWNYDPYRAPDFFATGPYWHSQVGEGKRYTAHSVTDDPPTPTWGGIATLDYVLSDFLEGTCLVSGEDPDTRYLDGDGLTMDHRAVTCMLALR